MPRNARFWIFMTVFQVAFGLAVFGATRNYYMVSTPAAEVSQRAPAQHPTEWPQTGQGSELEQLISTFPGQSMTTDPMVLTARADEAFVNQQFELAADLYRQMLVLDPNNADTYNNLGITLHYLGRSAEALQILNQGVTVDPNYQRIWLTLGFVSAQTGLAAEAQSALKTALELGPDTEVGQSAADMLKALDSG